MSLQVYGIPNCGTCKKAFQWLKENEIKYEFINIKDAIINTQQIYEKLKEILDSYILKDISISDKFSWEPGKVFSSDVIYLQMKLLKEMLFIG